MKFIIADDSPFCLYLFKNYLYTLGHSVIAEAKNGKELIRLVKKYQPQFILTDIEMLPLNGIDAAIEIHKLFPEIKIICSTQHNRTHWINEMQMIGISGYVFKNSGIESLANAIEFALENRFYTDNFVLKTLITELKKIFEQQSEQSEQSEFINEIREMVTEAIKVKDINGYKPNSRELFILSATAQGKPVKQIADMLKITDRHVSKIKAKLREEIGVHTNVEVLQLAILNRVV